MQIIRQLSRSFAPFALAALVTSAVANAEVFGSAAGQWMKVSPRSTTVQAILGDAKNEHAYALDGILLGHGYGQFLGKIEELPAKGEGDKGDVHKYVHLVYDVCGEFADFGDGVIYVQAQIMLDLTQFGGKDMVPVGVLDGMLLGTDAGGYCPVLPPSDPLGDDDLHPIGSAGAGKPLALGAAEPAKRAKPIEEPLPVGKFTAEWRLF